jgi:hypothetical protein
MMVTAEDFVGLHQLVALYAHIVDAREWHRVGDLFAEDGVFDMSAFGTAPVQGPEAIARLWAAQTHPAAHHNSNMVVTVSADRWSLLTKGFGHWPDGRVGSMIYRDVVGRGEAGYRFASRVALPGY